MKKVGNDDVIALVGCSRKSSCIGLYQPVLLRIPEIPGVFPEMIQLLENLGYEFDSSDMQLRMSPRRANRDPAPDAEEQNLTGLWMEQKRDEGHSSLGKSALCPTHAESVVHPELQMTIGSFEHRNCSHHTVPIFDHFSSWRRLNEDQASRQNKQQKHWYKNGPLFLDRSTQRQEQIHKGDRQDSGQSTDRREQENPEAQGSDSPAKRIESESMTDTPIRIPGCLGQVTEHHPHQNRWEQEDEDRQSHFGRDRTRQAVTEQITEHFINDI
jgi:hypothetical protein